MKTAAQLAQFQKIHRAILQIALPSIISNITVPLLGLIDVAIVGHLGAASYIGAIAVGGMLFNLIYWVFGFLRMGTGGMTSQAYGRGDQEEVRRLLIRSVTVGAAIALGMLLMQVPVQTVAFRLMDCTEEVEQLARRYYSFCIWGAPAVMTLYSFNGWFIGMQNTRIPMCVSIAQNVVNIVVSLVLVFGLGMKIEGVALGTVIAQYAGLLLALVLGHRQFPLFRFRHMPEGTFHRGALRRFFQVNRDIFLRTLCLVAVTLYFTTAGAAQGETILAVNTLLMQLFTLYAYFMDGIAYAGEALTGRFIGAKEPENVHLTVRNLFLWGGVVTLLFTLIYAVSGADFLSLLTDDESIRQAASTYFYWVLLIPVAGVTPFLCDGICVGATATRIMLWASLGAAIGFFAVYFLLHGVMGNHALWLAFIVYLTLRGVIQLTQRKKVLG
jgi:MATE family multidrug resistance protein